MSPDEAFSRLRDLPFEDTGFAMLDHHREMRKGFPEVVLGAGKTTQQIAEIARRLYEKSGVLLVTRTDRAAFEAVSKEVPDARFNELAGVVVADRRPVTAPPVPGVAVVTGGTADLPVAEEAIETARIMGCDVTRIADIGVAGVHRVLHALPALHEAKVLVVVAGMEGALPSVIAGLAQAPVIAVPTSTGYGASFGGLAALLAMLNSCAPGVSVVNIDNGFGAGYLAAVFARAIDGRA